MRRPVIDSEDGARATLRASLTRPPWLATERALPFTSLHEADFEILCFLLLKLEHPGETILLYGGPNDGGRDILRPASPTGCELVQCKRFQVNVGVGEIREELAKIATNVFRKVIPDCPNRVNFYVSRDLTADAKDLLRDQARWIAVAEGALREHLGQAPEPALLEFARSWWPGFDWQAAVDLTDRVNQHPKLREEVFEVT